MGTALLRSYVLRARKGGQRARRHNQLRAIVH
jgi:hypothetical protein